MSEMRNGIEGVGAIQQTCITISQKYSEDFISILASNLKIRRRGKLTRIKEGIAAPGTVM